MMGKPLAELLSAPAYRPALDQSFAQRAAQMPYWAVKESVFPFSKFPGVDVVLGEIAPAKSGHRRLPPSPSPEPDGRRHATAHRSF
jgi:hypothetical protein